MTIKKVEQNNLIYALNEKNKTAYLIGNDKVRGDILIPRSIIYDYQEFTIKIICADSFKASLIKSIKFPPDSELEIIEKNAFFNSDIEKIKIPKSLKKLNAGWCSFTKKLRSVTIENDNQLNIKNYENIFLIGKSDTKSEEYDVLLFADHSVKEIKFPSFIKKIGSFAFSGSSIERIFIPSFISHVGQSAFDRCKKLKTVEISRDTKLEVIEKELFMFTSIEKFIVPLSVKKICENSFSYCSKLRKIEIQKESKLEVIQKDAFSCSPIESILIPSTVKELENGWCSELKELTKVTIMPNNERYIYFNDELIVEKNDLKSNEYDVLNFARRDIKNVKIPSFIKKIASHSFAKSSIESIFIPPQITSIDEYAFNECSKLQNLEIPPDSKLQIIGKFAFHTTSIKNVFIPISVTKICENAFQEILIDNIFIPQHVTHINSGSFFRYNKLKKVIFAPN